MTSARKLLRNGRPERDEKGRLHWKVRVKTQAGAWSCRRVWAKTDIEAMVIANEDAGGPVDGVTWSKAVALWDAAHSTPGGPTYRVERYRSDIRRFGEELITLIGDKRLEDTSRQDFQRFIDSKTHGSGRTANNARSLRQVAVWLKGRQDTGPLPFLDVPCVEEGEGKARTAIPRDQWATYIGAAKEPLRFLIEFLFATGWRSMEAAGLTEDRIREGRIHTILKGGKSWSIPLSPALSALFARARAWKATHGHQDHARMFLNAKGRPWSKDRLRARWTAHQKAGKVPAVRLVHEIRHSVCTYLGSIGMSPRQISSLTGHRSPATLERYTHATDEAAALASAALVLDPNLTQEMQNTEQREGMRGNTEEAKSGGNGKSSGNARARRTRACDVIAPAQMSYEI
jgi:integrase